jgi:hypothetical protein
VRRRLTRDPRVLAELAPLESEERLVLLATPAREDGGVPPIGAKTLLLFGMDDECTGSVLE